ncbi:MAG: hypothetical protein JW942_09335 [Opitutales bacterium]|nr:hypothetical protein [Opitutales bacterium]
MVAFLFILTTYLLATLVLSSCQSFFLYHPTHRDDGDSRQWQIGGRHSGFVLREGSPERPVWLILHGNAGQATGRDYIERVLPSGDTVYVLEYPGYGKRPGSPSMASINAAALEALRELQAKYPARKICIIGESIGSGPAAWLGSQESPPDRIVLAVPYCRLADLVQSKMPLFPAGLILRDRWDNAAALKDYKGSLEIFVASADKVIPPRHGRALRDALPQCVYRELPGGHNDWSAGIGRLQD